MSTRAVILAVTRMAFAVALVAPSPVRAQAASIVGTVLLDSIETPLANAEVVFTDLHVSTRTDSAGNFLITRLPAGTHSIVVRLVGYESYNAQITFGAGQKVEADFLLRRVATKLDKVVVKAKDGSLRDFRLAEFEEHRKSGQGKFLTADIFAKADGRLTSSMIRSNVAGVTVKCGNFSSCILGGRASMTMFCPVQVIVNGLITFRKGMTMFDINSINAADILGVEYYTVGSAPLQYSGTTGGCGTVVIWTK